MLGGDQSFSRSEAKVMRRRIHSILLAAVAMVLVPGSILVFTASAAQKAAKTKAVRAKTPAELIDDAPPNKNIGSRTAPIMIEVFSDYQCPACRALYTDTLRPLMDNYVSTGKVYLVHHDFPLPMHRWSREAAKLVNAAAKIGKFEKAEAALYSKQESWDKDGNLDAALATALTPAELQRVKQIAGSGKMDPFIESDVALGNSKQIHQTPSLFVTHGGQTDALPPGGVTYSLLKRYLDQLLVQ
jgi:protein-disulfide isomerase